METETIDQTADERNRDKERARKRACTREWRKRNRDKINAQRRADYKGCGDGTRAYAAQCQRQKARRAEKRLAIRRVKLAAKIEQLKAELAALKVAAPQ